MSPYIRALYDARLIAIKLGHTEVHPRHIIIGVLATENMGSIIVSRHLAKNGQNIAMLRDDTLASLRSLKHSPSLQTIDSIRFTPDGKLVSDVARAKAIESEMPNTGCEHLLLALLIQRGRARRLLNKYGITRECVEHEISCIYAF